MPIVFKDDVFDGQWLRAAGHSSSGGAEIGECLAAARQIREPDPESWFAAWSESHPTHVAIFDTFMKMVQAMNFNLQLRLYHEVAVVKADEQQFEYVNCHPKTGLLRTIA